tara:strand:- start:2 stop:484 length:483 start_codon:yes stop_codon:yes gene_type:complete
MNKKELESNNFYTVNKLSELTGADRRTLNKRLAGEEPAHVHAGKKYYELNHVIEKLEETSGEGTDKQRLECQKLISQIRNIDLRNDALSKNLIPADEIQRVWLNHIGKARGVLLKLDELAPCLVGLKVNEIKGKLKEAALNVIEELNEAPLDDPQLNQDT